jgi:hypothetical protein
MNPKWALATIVKPVEKSIKQREQESLYFAYQAVVKQQELEYLRAMEALKW